MPSPLSLNPPTLPSYYTLPPPPPPTLPYLHLSLTPSSIPLLPPPLPHSLHPPFISHSFHTPTYTPLPIPSPPPPPPLSYSPPPPHNPYSPPNWPSGLLPHPCPPPSPNPPPPLPSHTPASSGSNEVSANRLSQYRTQVALFSRFAAIAKKKRAIRARSLENLPPKLKRESLLTRNTPRDYMGRAFPLLFDSPGSQGVAIISSMVAITRLVRKLN